MRFSDLPVARSLVLGWSYVMYAYRSNSIFTLLYCYYFPSPPPKKKTRAGVSGVFLLAVTEHQTAGIVKLFISLSTRVKKEEKKGKNSAPFCALSITAKTRSSVFRLCAPTYVLCKSRVRGSVHTRGRTPSPTEMNERVDRILKLFIFFFTQEQVRYARKTVGSTYGDFR